MCNEKEADREQTKQAYANQCSIPNASGTLGRRSAYGNELREQLWKKQSELQYQLREIEEALRLLNEDAAVQNVIKVLTVANK